MGISWNKKANENKKRLSKIQKETKKQERKENAVKGQKLEDMMAYLDEDGNLTTVPPHLREKPAKDDEAAETK